MAIFGYYPPKRFYYEFYNPSRRFLLDDPCGETNAISFKFLEDTGET
jgi:hypothetical protein